MSQSQPATLGKYQIIREIARSNDIVYEAYDPVMNRRVAVKELAIPGGSTDAQKEDRLKRFMREARAAGSLTHPNIVTIFEVGEDQGRTYLAMEYLDGKNLRNELDKQGFLPRERAVEIAKAVLNGLTFAHSKGVIHRDIKPDNIQLLENGAVKITDFGIARLTFEPNLTMDGQVFGTPSYMSPEQINGKDLDSRSDIFSVGVILYEMLSGQKPFPGDTVVTIAYAIMNREPQMPSGIAYPLWEVIETSLNKMPQFRYHSAEGMLAALERAESSFVSANPSTPPPPSVFGGGAGYGAGQGMNPMGQSPYPPSGPYGGGSGAYGASPGSFGVGGTGPGQVIHQPYNPAGYGVMNQPYSNPYGQGPMTGPPPVQQGSYGTGAPQGYAPGQVYGPGQGAPPGLPYGGQTSYGAGQPYNPYGQASPYGSSGTPQVPVYYPPPPRRPLLSPEARGFLSRLGLTILLVITLLVLVFFAVTSLVNVAERGMSSQGSRVARSGSPSAAPQGGSARSGNSQEEARGQPAAGQPSQGESANNEPPPPTPRESFDSGVNLSNRASSEPIEDRRSRLWRDSQLAFLAAADADRARSGQWKEAAVNHYISLAQALFTQGKMRIARQALQTAEGVAIGSDDLLQRIRTLQEQLGV